MTRKISAIILSQNNETLLSGCLKSLAFADEIIVVDAQSTDKTVEIAKRYGVKVISESWLGFAAMRDLGAREAKGYWLLYVDSDERVSPELRRELVGILKTGSDETYTSYRIPRKNYLLGKWLKYGDWYPEPQHRFIKKAALKNWTGALHENPIVTGGVGLLKGHLNHLTHRGLEQMLTKTIHYTRLEAELRLKNNHPKVRIVHLFSAPAREFWRRLIITQGWRDGIEGFIEIIYQAFNQFLIMVWLWEMRAGKTMPEKYEEIDKNLDKENTP